MSPELRDKLSKLIPRLSTDQDGEIVGTVLAIGRVLKSEGLDFHDLAKALSLRSPLSGTAFYYSQQRPEKPPKAGLYTREGFLRDWKQIAEEVLERHKTVSKRYGGKFLLPHQIEMLQRIKDGLEPGHLHEIPIRVIDDRMRTAFEAWRADKKSRAA